MTTILHSPVSVVHLLAALTTLGTGTYILFTPKGTTTHRFAGRIYVVSMLVLLLSAFQIYYLFGRFGVIHWGAVGSGVTLLIGVGAVRLRAVLASWLQWHYLGMGASVTGLYAALVVESTYRLFPPSLFWWATLGSATVVFSFGGVLLYRYYPGRSGTSGASPGRLCIHRANQAVNPTDGVVYPEAV